MNETKNIQLGHGSGGRLTHELIEGIFKPKFSNDILDAMDDAATLALNSKTKIAFTTDSFVVNPIIFPGGDIGKLAVYGTVNDLAMKGAKPLWISVAAIIEEGFEIDILKKIVSSIADAAKISGVKIVAGDTKVVEKNKADKIFITTSGIGLINPGADISGDKARPGDDILINGIIGEHGIAVLAARNEFRLNSRVKSDCAGLNHIVENVLSTCPYMHVLRDPTRGGVATTLNEIAKASNVGLILEENALPISKEVYAACNILGLDPLYVANEGKFLAIAPGKYSSGILKTMKKHNLGKNASKIGTAVKSPKGVWLKTREGGLRPLIMLEGEQLPRIC